MLNFYANACLSYPYFDRYNIKYVTTDAAVTVAVINSADYVTVIVLMPTDLLLLL
jgi:hypothetical protein